MQVSYGTFKGLTMKQARSRRTHILLPEDLLREIDKIAGSRGRSAFLVDSAREAVQRYKLLSLLESDTPTWKDEDHLELAKGSAAWVRKLRRQNEERDPNSCRPGEHPRSKP